MSKWTSDIKSSVSKIIEVERKGLSTSGGALLTTLASLTAKYVAAAPPKDRNDVAAKCGGEFATAYSHARSDMHGEKRKPDDKLKGERSHATSVLRIGRKTWHAEYFRHLGSINATMPLSYGLIVAMSRIARDEDAAPSYKRVVEIRAEAIAAKKNNRGISGRTVDASVRLNQLDAVFNDKDKWLDQIPPDARAHLVSVQKELATTLRLWNAAVKAHNDAIDAEESEEE